MNTAMFYAAETVMRGAAIFLLVWLLATLFKLELMSLRFRAFWLLAFLLVLLPAAMLAPVDKRPAIEVPTAILEAPATMPIVLFAPPPVPRFEAAEISLPAPAPQAKPVPVWVYAAAIYAAVAAALLLFRLAAWLYWRRRISRLPAVENPAVLTAFAALNPPRRTKLADGSGVIDCPAGFGVFHPTVIFPVRDAAELSAAQLEMMLLHEIEHIRRFDPLRGMAMMVISELFWFNPFVRWFAHRFAVLRELACDRSVMRKLPAAGAESYAKLIFEYQLRQRSRPSVLCPGLSARSGQTKTRIMELMMNRKRRIYVLTAAMIFAVAAVAALPACKSGAAKAKEPNKTDAAAAEKYPTNSDEVKAYYHGANAMLARGENKAAADRYLWLWDHMIEIYPAMRGVRTSLMLSNMNKAMLTLSGERTDFLLKNEQKRADLLAGRIPADKAKDAFNDITSVDEYFSGKSQVEFFKLLHKAQPETAKQVWPWVRDDVIEAKEFGLANCYIDDQLKQFKDIENSTEIRLGRSSSNDEKRYHRDAMLKLGDNLIALAEHNGKTADAAEMRRLLAEFAEKYKDIPDDPDEPKYKESLAAIRKQAQDFTAQPKPQNAAEFAAYWEATKQLAPGDETRYRWFWIYHNRQKFDTSEETKTKLLGDILQYAGKDSSASNGMRDLISSRMDDLMNGKTDDVAADFREICVLSKYFDSAYPDSMLNFRLVLGQRQPEFVRSLYDGAPYEYETDYARKHNLQRWPTAKVNYASEPEAAADKYPRTDREVFKYYEEARNMAARGEYEASANRYLWLWNNATGCPGMGGVRNSYLLADLNSALKQFPERRSEFLAANERRRTDLLSGKIPKDGWVDNFSDVTAVDREFSGKSPAEFFAELDKAQPEIAKYVWFCVIDDVIDAKDFATASRHIPDPLAQYKKNEASAEKSLILGGNTDDDRKFECRQTTKRAENLAALAEYQGKMAEAAEIRKLLAEFLARHNGGSDGSAPTTGSKPQASSSDVTSIKTDHINGVTSITASHITMVALHNRDFAELRARLLKTYQNHPDTVLIIQTAPTTTPTDIAQAEQIASEIGFKSIIAVNADNAAAEPEPRFDGSTPKALESSGMQIINSIKDDEKLAEFLYTMAAMARLHQADAEQWINGKSANDIMAEAAALAGDQKIRFEEYLAVEKKRDPAKLVADTRLAADPQRLDDMRKQRKACAENLKLLARGAIQFANEHNGELPVLSDKVQYAKLNIICNGNLAKLLYCPAATGKAPYIFFADGINVNSVADPSTFPMFIDSGMHDDLANVVFLDGHCLPVRSESATAAAVVEAIIAEHKLSANDVKILRERAAAIDEGRQLSVRIANTHTTPAAAEPELRFDGSTPEAFDNSFMDIVNSIKDDEKLAEVSCTIMAMAHLHQADSRQWINGKSVADIMAEAAALTGDQKTRFDEYLAIAKKEDTAKYVAVLRASADPKSREDMRKKLEERSARQSECMNNLKLLVSGVIQFEDEHNGVLPVLSDKTQYAELDKICDGNLAKLLHCPASKVGVNYIFFAEGIDSRSVTDRSTFPVFMDVPGAHEKFVDVAFLDGHCLLVRSESATVAAVVEAIIAETKLSEPDAKILRERAAAIDEARKHPVRITTISTTYATSADESGGSAAEIAAATAKPELRFNGSTEEALTYSFMDIVNSINDDAKLTEFLCTAEAMGHIRNSAFGPNNWLNGKSVADIMAEAAALTGDQKTRFDEYYAKQKKMINAKEIASVREMADPKNRVEKLTKASDAARNAVCFGNLKQLGQAALLFAKNHNNATLPVLSDKAQYDEMDKLCNGNLAKLLNCPMAKTGVNYIFFAEGIKPESVETGWTFPMFMDVPGTHKDGVNAVYLDGHIGKVEGKFASVAEVVEKIIKDHKLPENDAKILRERAKAIDSQAAR